MALGLAKRFHAFLVERKLKQFECTNARDACVERLLRFHARHRKTLSFCLSREGGVGGGKVNSSTWLTHFPLTRDKFG